MAPFFSAFVKVSDSTSLRRTHRPMMTMTAEKRNGTRQPQARNSRALRGPSGCGSAKLMTRKSGWR
jgi:hypothetical protein